MTRCTKAALGCQNDDKGSYLRVSNKISRSRVNILLHKSLSNCIIIIIRARFVFFFLLSLFLLFLLFFQGTLRTWKIYFRSRSYLFLAYLVFLIIFEVRCASTMAQF